jgi:3-dehydroquinate dehydratase type I
MMKICGSIIPLSSGELRKNVTRAFELGADFLEIRFDYVEPRNFAEAVKAARPFKDKCIYTLRRTSQGGNFVGSGMERLNHLRDLGREIPMMIDIELETLEENPEIGSMMNSLLVPMLVSWHDFEFTPSPSEMFELMVKMRSYSKNNKLVTMANSYEDVLKVLDLYESSDKSGGLVAFCMGAIGVISRVLCALAPNCPFTYASIDQPVAPGQMTIEQMKRLYNRIDKVFSLRGD